MPGERGQRRNVLCIVIDQLRADVLQGGLAAAVPTPHLDAFAAGAAVFRHHHTVTMPCGPSRASLLTGQYPFNHGAVCNGTPLKRDAPNLALAVRRLGYEPLLFGYTDTQPDPRGLAPRDPARFSYTQPLQGFTEIVEMRDEAWAWLAHLRARGYDVPDAESADFQRLYRPEGGRLGGKALYGAEDSDTAFLTDETLKALDVRRGKNWFALVSYIRPHPPFVAPAPYHALIDPAAMPKAQGPAPNHPFVEAYFSEPSAQDMVWGFDGQHEALDDRDVALIRSIYGGLVAEVDHHVGRLLHWLEDSDQAEDTLVIITADHGEMLGDYGMWGKLTPFEQSHHVPLMIRDPSRGPATVEAPTASVDIAPTILDWLGSQPPPAMDGGSLLPAMAGGGDPRSWVLVSFQLGDPTAATRFERAWRVPAHLCSVVLQASAQGLFVHFPGGLPPLVLARGPSTVGTSDSRGAPTAEEVSHARGAILNHLLAHLMTGDRLEGMP
ncbi:MAG: sulfatase-like hydrolase/transferase [Candidatus Competibacterales bacterium]